MKVIVKPHPATIGRQYHEWIDVYTEDGDLPWTGLHIDFFYPLGKDALDALFKEGKTLDLELIVNKII